MIRNLKALGLALFAFLAFGAMATASASAQETLGEFFETNNSYPVHLVGEDVPPTAGEPTAAFTGGGNTLECGTTAYTANIAKETKEVTVTASYGKCSTSTGQPVTVTMNECHYKFYHATTLEPGVNEDKWSVTADLTCPEGKKVELHEYADATKHAENKSNCTITVGNQTGVTGITLAEETDTDTLEIKGSPEFEAQTHGACSFGLTIGLNSTLHLSATMTATEGKEVGITH